MKDLVENSTWFGVLILVVYFAADVLDAKYVIPRLANSCKGALTEQQAEQCYHWYYVKEKVNGRREQNPFP